MITFRTLSLGFTLGVASLGVAMANVVPDDFVRGISNSVLSAAKTDAPVREGDLDSIISLVDTKVMPFVDLQAVTRSAVGPRWRNATAAQRAQLQAAFKLLMIRVYSGALSHLDKQTIEVEPSRRRSTGPEVVVKSQVRGTADPIEIDYRLEQSGATWQIIDVSVAGIWLVTTYRAQFAEVLSNSGIQGLIERLDALNGAATKTR
jgi:phospholipid transport system substrate-binding protein